jgi:glycosyltransferase involved in cell wall biosynthesis
MGEGKTLIHITHETIGKIGGIGSVLAGLFTSKAYLEKVSRSIIVGPLFSFEGPVNSRLGDDVEVLYSSADGIYQSNYSQAFRRIEQAFNAPIIYGKRTFFDGETEITSSPEILLIDVRIVNRHPVDDLKRKLFEHFGIRSNLYEHIWEYEQYVRLAPVAIAILKAIVASGDDTYVISHEFMGIPTALAAALEPDFKAKTSFYAHEVATVRNIVEKHPGHDTMFYNVMQYSQKNNFFLSEVFGDQSEYFKHPLIEAAKNFDCILAVGDYVAEELRFLAPGFKNSNINIVYNGIPSYRICIEDKFKSKEKLQRYCEILLGYRPDFICTHVTRLVKSKGLWRDLKVLEHIDKDFQRQNKTGVLFLLSTEVCQKSSRLILQMESGYNWPVAHREGWPDLSGGEAEFYTSIQKFNAKSRNVKVIFINQFGFCRKFCGNQMPEDIEFIDIRKGSDVEFGMSVYEPFGISHIESLAFGAVCVISNVCGCAGFVRDVTGGKEVNNIIVADYVNLHEFGFDTIENLVQIDASLRRQMEQKVSEKIASQILSKLSENPNDVENMIISGYELAKNMSWEVVVGNYVLPSLEKIQKAKIDNRLQTTDLIRTSNIEQGMLK